jgi:hypothetical protein
MPQAKTETKAKSVVEKQQRDQEPSIIIEGKEYKESQLTSDQIYCINQVQDLQSQLIQLDFKVKQLQAAESVFRARLEVSLKSTEKDS